MPDPVFLDRSGRRWQRTRWTAIAAGVLTTVLLIAIVVSILSPPVLPAITSRLSQRSVWSAPHLVLRKEDRRRIAARRRLFMAIVGKQTTRGKRYGFFPSNRHSGTRKLKPVIAGFYVNWDDNSLASLREHIDDLDWVVCEWAFVNPARGPPLLPQTPLRLAIDKRVFDIQRVAARRPATPTTPRIFLMVTNIDPETGRFDPERVRSLVSSRASRSAAIIQLSTAVRMYNLAGITLDLEEIPDDLQDVVTGFARELRAALTPSHALLTVAISSDTPLGIARQNGEVADYVFLMLYDQHYGRGDPGPVAAQEWYVERARRLLRVIPSQKTILATGEYGYDWNDAEGRTSGSAMTFQEVMTAAHDHKATIQFDTIALNPYITWTDPDSTDHAVWYLDGVTAYNQMLAGRELGVAGHAIWRLGSEDPSLWATINSNGDTWLSPQLDSIPPSYDVEFAGTGELLRLAARPSTGVRKFSIGPRGTITHESIVKYPSPYVVARFGASYPHRVALTFDDGPDPTWTPQILDTLLRYHVPATFFTIGKSIERHIPLTRRIVREGHEIGNHTFTHPNLALTSSFMARLEIDATARVLEAVIGRRTVLFRPPYFGDAEPTTNDELVAIGIANDLGYLTAGIHVDAEDWRLRDPNTIVRQVLAQRHRGNVVLLHDGGGNRAPTLAALGPMIDSLRAHGDTLVLLSALAGMSRTDVMPPLPISGNATRVAELGTFALFGITEWGLHWIFILAIVLGIARVLVLTTLALWQRYRKSHDQRVSDAQYSPTVTVIVPAYNEEKVISRTVQSLLLQDYAGDVEIIVVDDGSSDNTAEVVQRRFGGDSRVHILRQVNSGKASALNTGIALARGDILVTLDADTIFLPDTVACLVSRFADASVAAVAGNAKVGNRINIVTRWQALEYVTTQNIDRRAFELLNCITVVPGAVGAWRASVVRAVGGFNEDTLAEDQDLTLNVRRQGYTISYAHDAIAYTEAPDSLRGLARQRFRWSFGTLQCMWKHRDALFKWRYGTLGFIAMPNVWAFQLIFTALSPVVDFMFVWSLVSVWLTEMQHGATYAVTDLHQIILFFTIFVFLDWLGAVVAFLAEPDEDKRLAWLIVLQRFAYRQVMYWVVGKSFLVAWRGHIVGWGKLERKDTVGIPKPA